MKRECLAESHFRSKPKSERNGFNSSFSILHSSFSPGDTLLDAALQQDIPLEHECGGNCACTTCHVIVLEGGENLSTMEEVEADRLSTADGLTPRSRLACQAILRGGDVVVLLSA